jgi:hypothetical protein
MLPKQKYSPKTPAKIQSRPWPTVNWFRNKSLAHCVSLQNAELDWQSDITISFIWMCYRWINKYNTSSQPASEWVCDMTFHVGMHLMGSIRCCVGGGSAIFIHIHIITRFDCKRARWVSAARSKAHAHGSRWIQSFIADGAETASSRRAHHSNLFDPSTTVLVPIHGAIRRVMLAHLSLTL